jgi:hypothetical protein
LDTLCPRDLKIVFGGDETKKKFKHLVRKLVVDTGKGLSATSTYKEVFADYVEQTGSGSGTASATSDGGSSSTSSGNGSQSGSGSGTKAGTAGGTLPKGALFGYAPSTNSAIHQQLMKEAKSLNCEKFPAAGTALLRCIVETLLKSIIHDQGANVKNNLLSLETAIDICLGNHVQLNADDKKILKEFKKSHLDYVNLGTHGTTVPNPLRLMAARDCIDQFVMRNI